MSVCKYSGCTKQATCFVVKPTHPKGHIKTCTPHAKDLCENWSNIYPDWWPLDPDSSLDKPFTPTRGRRPLP